MYISMCRNLDDSFPSGLWPPNLTTLKIGGLKKPISEWGAQKFPTSLVTLYLRGGENSYLHGNESSRVGSFAKGQDIGNATSSSLTKLYISDFMELESLAEGLQHLTCLKELVITVCPKLRDLPETLLPSLSSLRVIDSSLKLRKKCRSRNGKYWPIISQIPDLEID
ncbi:putative leucine-rich repeat domain superfamily [Helianthus annuus]|nr:putative leucine-rich repeat domain superfamily [Helianthus annuus]